MLDLITDVLTAEYDALIGRVGDDAIVSAPVREADWTEPGAREVLQLARRYGRVFCGTRWRSRRRWVLRMGMGGGEGMGRGRAGARGRRSPRFRVQVSDRRVPRAEPGGWRGGGGGGWGARRPEAGATRGGVYPVYLSD